MARTLIRTALRRSLDQVHHVRSVPPGAASGLVARVYAQLERDFGMLAPPIALHAPAPEPLAASWTLLRETLLAAGNADRAAKEAVATAVSLSNACPYCVEVHGATLGGLIRPGDTAAITGDRIGSVADARVRAIAEWARSSGVREGTARSRLPFPIEQLPEFAGVALTFHYLNRMVNVFLTESPLPKGVPDAVRPGVRRFLGWLTRPKGGRAPEPGRSLDLLPAAPLPPDLSWAAGSPTVAEALARTSAAIEAAGARSVPKPVRDLVQARLATWNGDPPGLSRAWVHDAVSQLPVADRPAGRLTLLTAMASSQVDQAVIDGFGGGQPDDEALIQAVSWASLAAARRLGSRLANSHTDEPQTED